MNQIKFENVNGKYVRAVATIPTQKGEARLEVLRAQNGTFFYVRESKFAGAEAVFPNFYEVRKYYKALRNVTEEQFLNAMSTQGTTSTLGVE